MTQAVTLRAARRDEARTIARLYSISSDGVAEYIWTQLSEPGEDILDVGERRYSRKNTEFSFQNCVIAEVNGEIAGMMVSFPMEEREETIDGAEIDPVLAPYSLLEQPNSLYVCGVALFEGFRGRGIGTQFMTHAEQKSRDLNLAQLSLIVFEQNAGAKRLYERLGYREVGREPVVPHRLIRYTGDAVLMVKKID